MSSDEASVVRRLTALQAPELELARERAVAAVPELVRSARELAAPRPRGRLAASLSLALLAMLAAFALLTPPGQALTSWVGQQAGLGEPGGHPTLQSLRHFAIQGTAAAGKPAYVLVRGPAPHGGHYELVGTAEGGGPQGARRGRAAECFELELTQARSLYGGPCGLPASRHGLILSYGGNAASRFAVSFADGTVSEDVAAVEASFDGRTVPAELRPVPPRLRARLGIRRPFKFFIAFLGGAPHGGVFSVIARDASGAVVARRSARLPGSSPLRELTCRMDGRAVRAGKLKPKFARRACAPAR